MDFGVDLFLHISQRDFTPDHTASTSTLCRNAAQIFQNIKQTRDTLHLIIEIHVFWSSLVLFDNNVMY